MAVVVQRVVDRSIQDLIGHLETEYFRWVNAELEAEFGIRLDIEAMIARDLSELEIYLPPRGALFVAVDGIDLVGMIFLAPIRDDTAQIRRMYVRASRRRQGVGGTLFGARRLPGPRLREGDGLPRERSPRAPAPLLDLPGL